ncbi:Hpt domain-containing protein [Nocardioides convexus]|uniref:Hpt domain-containing protein n=1 Tax=Nocardioides convexus TaxID=2712224 RepID=UPI0024182C2A|nr:Hpt domain-containing protein [Nocardioides convexus]
MDCAEGRDDGRRRRDHRRVPRGVPREPRPGLDRDLVELEQQPDSRERLSSIFRTIHTIKGTSGFLAFNRLEQTDPRGGDPAVAAARRRGGDDPGDRRGAAVDGRHRPCPPRRDRADQQRHRPRGRRGAGGRRHRRPADRVR